MNRFIDVGDAILRETDAMFLDALKKLYDQGHKSALFGAIKFCATKKLVMPDWVAKEFVAGMRKIDSFEVGTGTKLLVRRCHAGKQLGAMRKRAEKQLPVWHRIRELHKGGDSIDGKLFDRVGLEFQISGSTAKSYFYDVESCPEFFGLRNF